jgi:polyisoprenyl-teichoic acid--peptidoglycan teichoic acid transferase
MSLCEFCGSEIPEDARFCGKCGRLSRGSRQTANGSNAAVNRGIPGPASVPDSQRRSIRRPYQYQPPSPQQYQNSPAAEPTVDYAPVAAPVQQAPKVAPLGVQSYPNAQPQGPIYIGGPGPNAARPVKPPRRPAYRRKGCLISFAVVLLLLVVFFSIAIPTVQKVLAFGSAISTQSPLSSQTGYMGGSDRVNILMLGYGGSGHDGAYLTDSMVIMSLIPSSHHTTLISVPRDLWVQNPANSGYYTKINAVYPVAAGNTNSDPVAGGNATAQKVSLVTGLQVNYWMTINFTGFRDFINAIGGVDVDVPDSFTANYPINDDPSINAGWKVIHFSKGLQHMNGETAIEYARARYVTVNLAEGTDFARSVRQQIIMKAALTKLKNWHTWPNLFSAMDALKRTIYTNLSLADLGEFALKMDLNNAHRVGLNNDNVLVDTTSNDGQAILLPRGNNWSQIPAYIQQQLYN